MSKGSFITGLEMHIQNLDRTLNVENWYETMLTHYIDYFGESSDEVRTLESTIESYRMDIRTIFLSNLTEVEINRKYLVKFKEILKRTLNKLKKPQQIQTDVTQSANDFDETTLSYMRLAIECGKKSVAEERKLTPKVGAVLVKDNKFLGSSHRGQIDAGDHAEYTLFQKILNGADVSGSSLFTTLEPCTARGKHKPCTDWVIEKGIKHVYIGLLDPNPKIYNIGCKKLIAAGIEVSYFPRELRNEIIEDNSQFISQFHANSDLIGIASFNYTNNNGKYIIGNGEMLFETMWTKASDQAIHVYNDPASIRTIAIADGFNEISDVKDGSIYDTSSRARTVHVNEIVIIENNNGYFAAVKVLEIKDKTRPNNDRDEVKFEFVILPDKTYNFTRF